MTPTASAARRVGASGSRDHRSRAGVVAVQRGDLAAQVPAARVAAEHVDVAPVRGRRGMVQRDRHRAHAAPAVTAQVVALDRRGAAPAAALEPAHHVDEASHARGCHLGAREQGGALGRPAAGGGRGRLAVSPAARVGEDDRRRAPGHADHEHGTDQPGAAHVRCAGSWGRGSWPAHSTHRQAWIARIGGVGLRAFAEGERRAPGGADHPLVAAGVAQACGRPGHRTQYASGHMAAGAHGGTISEHRRCEANL